ncbi:Clp protease-domain-containing protein [Yarrowia lipolytica]|nr:Clp protease-domain-containing protein [Yarrowia lipolytica]RDW42894.1 Clp protease-domain-containing protein [Yarrowia lipolytica]RDW49636.1 Clp protease-domain-containing protein [Yarrowia lipolytica]
MIAILKGSSRVPRVRQLAAVTQKRRYSDFSIHDIPAKLLNERIVHVAGPIDDSMATSVVAQLLYLEHKSAQKPIHMYINSPGGAVTAGFAILDTMNYIRSPVHTVCLGQAASMASLLLTCGAPGNRIMTPNSTIMTHEPLGGIVGSSKLVELHTFHLQRIRTRIIQLYYDSMKLGLEGRLKEEGAEETHEAAEPTPLMSLLSSDRSWIDTINQKTLTHSLVDTLIGLDQFFNADEALKLGLVDRILKTKGE